MKKFLLIQNGKSEPVGKYATKAEAADVMEQIIDENNDDLDSDDENYLTAFDFRLEEVEIEEINEIVVGFEDARRYLNGKPNNDFTVAKKVLSGNCVQLDEVTRLVKDLNPTHTKALIALNELFTIAQAWNKADNFVPDFSDSSQYKYYPWFVYDKDRAGFVAACTAPTAAQRMRISVLGFASKPQIVRVNSVKCSRTCTTKFS